MEKENAWALISGHPLKDFEKEIKERVTLFSSNFTINNEEKNADIPLSECKKITDGKNVYVGGIIASKITKTTKNGNLMAFITLEDLFGTMEIIVFPSTLERYGFNR